MKHLLSKLSGTPKNKLIEPREIFMSLTKKDKQYAYPRDVQSEVWKKWFEKRDQKNTIIKMNTGSGKTIVGLMILQSCLNEEKGPAIYIVPDNYLAAQVCEEAKKLGISTTVEKDDYDYTGNKSILVAPIHTLVNGKSVFGMRNSGNYPIGSILLDDVHACLNTIASQFSLEILSSHELYNKIITIFESFWKTYHSKSYTNIVEIKETPERFLLPFWIWQEKKDDIYRLLKEYDNDKQENRFVFFNLPLIADCLDSCSCVITTHSIEITPKGIPISKISKFEHASRRIFMSATLADDSVFVSAIGLKKNDINEIITPDKANDIGTRLILFPKHLNRTITDEDIKRKVFSLAEKHNVAIIVPSHHRGKFWDETGSRLVTKENIEKIVSDLKKGHVGLVVFVNRYDGIDMPDDACRLLIIDGLPSLRSEYDKYVQSINPSNTLLLREQIQKIEQGMGRGVRSNSDSCCIILTGNKLEDSLLRNEGISHFSNATREQYNLSKELWDLLKQENSTPTIDEIFELADYSFDREDVWIEKSRERLSSVAYNTIPNIDEITVALRTAFDMINMRQWNNATEILDTAINKENDQMVKGYLMQIKAEYTNFFDKSQAQQILLSARRFNQGVLLPTNGIQYIKLINNKHQAKGVKDYSADFNKNPNEYIIHIEKIMNLLNYESCPNEFEKAIQETGKILGFDSSRPDKETSGKGSDNLWALGNDKYLVIECKNNAAAHTISKDYCNQLGGSSRWFETQYGKEYECTPVMIHKTNLVDKQATPPGNMRVITPESLDYLKKQIHDFAVALVQKENWGNETKINTLLSSYKLRSHDITQEYTVNFKMQSV